jgi:hypothetical protein
MSGQRRLRRQINRPTVRKVRGGCPSCDAFIELRGDHNAGVRHDLDCTVLSGDRAARQAANIESARTLAGIVSRNGGAR